MKSTNWKDVWATRSFNSDSVNDTSPLDALIKADGFDTGMGDYSVTQWWELTKHISERLSVSRRHSLLEVGCGSGAFLYCIRKLTQCSVTGIDYSASLIEIARKYVSGKFVVSDAKVLPFSKQCFDFVISHSVFQYFPSKEYANNVLSEIYRVMKTGGKGCLMDLNDKCCEKSYYESRRILYKCPEEYDAKYQGLNHLFFDKDDFVRSLQKQGFSNVQLFPHCVPEYLNSRFRFNLTFERI